MTSATEELVAFVDSDSRLSRYLEAQNPGLSTRLRPKLRRFLGSSMDQVRARSARECSHEILKILDLEDLEAFREGVWKREATGAIAYPAQRDHTAHTVNNWLLGWYFYEHCAVLREAIGAAIDVRQVGRQALSRDDYFGHVWQYTSLLHDIGYLFEGSLGAMEPGFESKQAAIGLTVTDEYFHVLFWKHMKLTSADDRALAARPVFRLPAPPSSPSLSRIALYLRSVDDMGQLTAALAAGGSMPGIGSTPLPGDAFALWRHHFEAFGQGAAASRIGALEQAFVDHASRGVPKLELRVLDHGICSGLLQMKIATFFYRLMAFCEQVRRSPRDHDFAIRQAADALLERECTLDNPFDYGFWWSGIVWGSASAALHNMMQQKSWNSVGLKLDEEPLTYLGVLVDCLQDWDRYFVFHSNEREPVQGRDVRLRVEAGKVAVEFPGAVAKLEKDLDCALDGWREFVDLRALTT